MLSSFSLEHNFMISVPFTLKGENGKRSKLKYTWIFHNSFALPKEIVSPPETPSNFSRNRFWTVEDKSCKYFTSQSSPFPCPWAQSIC